MREQHKPSRFRSQRIVGLDMRDSTRIGLSPATASADPRCDSRVAPPYLCHSDELSTSAWPHNLVALQALSAPAGRGRAKRLVGDTGRARWRTALLLRLLARRDALGRVLLRSRSTERCSTGAVAERRAYRLAAERNSVGSASGRCAPDGVTCLDSPDPVAFCGPAYPLSAKSRGGQYSSL
jgi:hypothetical protein